MKPIVTFGEVMARLAAPEFERLSQARQLDVTHGGAEANVAGSICMLGGAARYVTALPKHALADACLASLRGIGIDCDAVLRSDLGRLGLYFLETGANQRPSAVIYDRADSAVALTPANQYDWDTVFSGAAWLHVSGITPALSQVAAEATRVAVEHAKRAGLQVSCDLNFRKKLWQWDASKAPRDLAEETMRTILPSVDVVIANEEDCADVLGIHAAETDVYAGELNTARYPDVARQVVKEFPNVSKVAITLRQSISASHNNWGAMLYSAKADTPHFAPLDKDGTYQSYKIKNIVDRVGGGDAFAAGLIFALNTPELSEAEQALRFAVASSCLAHSIKGDLNYSTRPEVEALMGGSASGRVVR